MIRESASTSTGGSSVSNRASRHAREGVWLAPDSLADPPARSGTEIGMAA
jgi:hypothetical protein